MASSVKVNGALIRQLRESQGMERKEFAELVGLSYQRMYEIEGYKQSTRPGTLRRIALALRVPPEHLAVTEPVSA